MIPMIPKALRRFFSQSIRVLGVVSLGSGVMAAEVKPEEATKDAPFVNSLGMRFVPVPGTRLLVSVWETRVEDYQAFITAKPRVWPKPEFEQGSNHPAVMVTLQDGEAFCGWLSAQERRQYRLPTDEEWSMAEGLGKERGVTPEERNVRASGYPWGKVWPPVKGAGNYGPKLGVDDFSNTSPVGSFGANALGIFDLGGNVWEWCATKFTEKGEERAIRGGAWNVESDSGLRSSSRSGELSHARFSSLGFRCILVLPGK